MAPIRSQNGWLPCVQKIIVKKFNKLVIIVKPRLLPFHLIFESSKAINIEGPRSLVRTSH